MGNLLKWGISKMGESLKGGISKMGNHRKVLVEEPCGESKWTVEMVN